MNKLKAIVVFFIFIVQSNILIFCFKNKFHNNFQLQRLFGKPKNANPTTKSTENRSNKRIENLPEFSRKLSASKVPLGCGNFYFNK